MIGQVLGSKMFVGRWDFAIASDFTLARATAGTPGYVLKAAAN
jgi:hypothetical protein